MLIHDWSNDLSWREFLYDGDADGLLGLLPVSVWDINNVLSERLTVNDNYFSDEIFGIFNIGRPTRFGEIDSVVLLLGLHIVCRTKNILEF